MFLTANYTQQIEQTGSLVLGMQPNVETIAYKEQPVIDCFVTTYPRATASELMGSFKTYFTYKENDPNIPFSVNQTKVIQVANLLFEDSQLLSKDFQDILEVSFNKSLLDKPTRPNRK